MNILINLTIAFFLSAAIAIVAGVAAAAFNKYVFSFFNPDITFGFVFGYVLYHNSLKKFV